MLSQYLNTKLYDIILIISNYERIPSKIIKLKSEIGFTYYIYTKLRAFSNEEPIRYLPASILYF